VSCAATRRRFCALMSFIASLTLRSGRTSVTSVSTISYPNDDIDSDSELLMSFAISSFTCGVCRPPGAG
jgi:hypothetical protein